MSQHNNAALQGQALEDALHLHADAAPLTLHSDKLVKLGLGIEGSMAACTLTRLAG